MTSPAPGTRPHSALPARRGRRGGHADSRVDILDAAKKLFAEHGFEGTSLRQVARLAGVDPAMIHHFFKGTDKLLALSVELPVDPEQVLSGVVGSDPRVTAGLPGTSAEMALRATWWRRRWWD